MKWTKNPSMSFHFLMLWDHCDSFAHALFAYLSELSVDMLAWSKEPCCPIVKMNLFRLGNYHYIAFQYPLWIFGTANAKHHRQTKVARLLRQQKAWRFWLSECMRLLAEGPSDSHSPRCATRRRPTLSQALFVRHNFQISSVSYQVATLPYYWVPLT